MPYAIAKAVAGWGLTPTTTLIILVVFYLVLGTFMDGFAMMVTTIPVILPILKTMNIDLVWFDDEGQLSKRRDRGNTG